jgi:LPXTG-site transpeptidase (sortase) family protein
MRSLINRQTALNLVMLVAGIGAIAYIIITSQLQPSVPLRVDDGSADLRLNLAQNDYLATIPQFERDAWVGRFAGQSRAAYPAAVRVPRLQIETGILGVGIDDQGLIWSPPRDAGHFMQSGRPGEGDNIVLVGHSGTGLVFSPLVDIVNGDAIILTTADGMAHRYRVAQRTIVPVRSASPDDLAQNVDYVLPTVRETLTIITCYPRDAYTHRLIVRAYPAP